MEVTFGATWKDPKKLLKKYPEFNYVPKDFKSATLMEDGFFTSVIVNEVEKTDAGFSLGLSLKKFLGKKGKNEILELSNEALGDCFSRVNRLNTIYKILVQRDYLGKLK